MTNQLLERDGPPSLELIEAVVTELLDAVACDSAEMHAILIELRRMLKRELRRAKKNGRVPPRRCCADPKITKVYRGAGRYSVVRGCCGHCKYCVALQLLKLGGRNCPKCVAGIPHVHLDRILHMPSESLILINNCSDQQCCPKNVTQLILAAIWIHIARYPHKTWYLQSKYPDSMAPYAGDLPWNVLVCTTLETNRDDGYRAATESKTPLPSERFEQFRAIQYDRKIVSISPIMAFDLEPFVAQITSLRPEHVWIDENSRPTTPNQYRASKEQIQTLIRRLTEAGIEVRSNDDDMAAAPLTGTIEV